MPASEISVHLASLRRYARFLCLSESEADLLVTRSLRAMVETSEPPDLTRTAFFTSFHRNWIPVDRPPFTTAEKLETMLAHLTPIDRAVLLLCVFEGFTTAEAASILDVPAMEVERRLDGDHGLAPSGQIRRVLIVEDEILTATQLAQIVTAMGLDPIGPAVSCTEAIAAAASGRPDLILSDIDLGSDGTGIDAMVQIRESWDVPVVFVTAFPSRLMDRALPERTYLIRKPINGAALSDCIRRAIALE